MYIHVYIVIIIKVLHRECIHLLTLGIIDREGKWNKLQVSKNVGIAFGIQTLTLLSADSKA